MATGITRHGTGRRMSQAVVHDGVVYLAGQVAHDPSGDITRQTEEALTAVDAALALAGSDRTRLLSAQVWLRDVAQDFGGMNAVWEAWLPQGEAPTRATCQALLADPALRVEIIVTAAVGA